MTLNTFKIDNKYEDESIKRSNYLRFNRSPTVNCMRNVFMQREHYVW